MAQRGDGSGDRAVSPLAGNDVWDDGPAGLLRRYVLPERCGVTVQARAGCRRRKIEARMRPLIDAVSTSRTARSVGGASVVAPAPVSDDRQVGDLLAIQGALALMNAKLSRFPAAQFRRFHNLAR